MPKTPGFSIQGTANEYLQRLRNAGQDCKWGPPLHYSLKAHIEQEQRKQGIYKKVGDVKTRYTRWLEKQGTQTVFCLTSKILFA